MPERVYEEVDWCGVASKVLAGDKHAADELRGLVTRNVYGQRAHDHVDYDEVMELIEIVYTKVLAALLRDVVDDCARLPGFIRTTARRSLLDYLKTRLRGHDFVSLEDADHLLGEASEPDDPALQRHYEDALSRLSAEEREVWQAKREYGSSSAAARKTRKALSSYKRLYRSAKLKLMDYYGIPEGAGSDE